MPADNVSPDLVWQIVNRSNSFLVKRKQAGLHVFSRDPMNLTGVHSRKQAGFVNPKAVGLQAGENGSIVLTTKKAGKQQTPSQSYHTTTYSRKNTGGRRVYKSVASTVSGYRSDLRQSAVSRASALQKARVPKKTSTVEPKLRGAKARRAQEASA